MKSHQKLLNFLSEQAERANKARSDALQGMASCIVSDTALSDATSMSNITLACILPDNTKQLTFYVSQLQVFTGMHRVFTQKAYKNPRTALHEFVELLRTTIRENIDDLQPIEQHVASLKAYSLVLRYAELLPSDGE